METDAKLTGRYVKGGESFAGRRVHVIGAGGCGVGALGQVLLAGGATVSGSDAADSRTVQRLISGGATISIGQRAQNIPADCDVVVYSAAIHEQNPELVAARRRGLDVLKYSEMLGRLMAERIGIALAGTHGKSTTTAMVAYALTAAGANPSFIVGASIDQLGGSSGVGRGKHFVVEACEFDRSFLNLHPRYAAILNIEEDHLDCYENLSAIVEAFRAFAVQVDPGGVLVANGDDRNVTEAVRAARCSVQTYALESDCTWSGRNVTDQRGRYRMDVFFGGKRFCKLALSIPGRHNASNALAAAALLYHAGLDGDQISTHLGAFTGAHRRMTLKGQLDGVTVVDDYAHHPTEIQVTLQALREFYQPGRLVCVFQPHQHSRTRFLLKDFARSFALANHVIVPDIYFVRDSQREKDYVSSQDLVAQIRLHGRSAVYLKTFADIVEHIQVQLRPGDLVVTMGAGNIWEVADEIVHRLGRNH